MKDYFVKIRIEEEIQVCDEESYETAKQYVKNYYEEKHNIMLEEENFVNEEDERVYGEDYFICDECGQETGNPEDTYYTGEAVLCSKCNKQLEKEERK